MIERAVFRCRNTLSGEHSATAEIAVQADLSRRLSLSIAARYGRTIYSRNATATIYSDADGSVTATDTTCRIKGTRPGNIPDAVAIAELSYRHRGWPGKAIGRLLRKKIRFHKSSVLHKPCKRSGRFARDSGPIH